MACLKKKYSPTWLSARSHEALNHLEGLDIFRKAHCIAIYHALPDEVQTAAFIEKWAGEKTILLPLVEGDDIYLFPYKGKHTLTCGVFGIQEPQRCDPFPEDQIDLMIIPGVAFDRKGNRIGRGKGYYDRLLSTLKAPRIGLCFSFQLMNDIPAEPFDISMNGIVTDQEIFLL